MGTLLTASALAAIWESVVAREDRHQWPGVLFHLHYLHEYEGCFVAESELTDKQEARDEPVRPFSAWVFRDLNLTREDVFPLLEMTRKCADGGVDAILRQMDAPEGVEVRR